MLKTETHNCFISQKAFIKPAKALLQLKEQQQEQVEEEGQATAVAVAAAAASAAAAAGNRSLCNVRA